ncbi:MAG TPA: polysaccharide lyase family protein, partial [Flavitalea sp.]|nr:polysaccharide lyase family protein [Flavitalea sp.]
MYDKRLRIRSYILLLFFFIGITSFGQSKVIWEIGASDNKPSGLALAPSEYKRFLEHDFGWEDRYFLIGYSKPEKDFPYVLPGPKDKWGGTAPTSGIRSHTLNILFGIETVSASDSFKLLVDLAGYQSNIPPLFKVTVNGKSITIQLPRNNYNRLVPDSLSLNEEYVIKAPVPPGTLHPGGNEARLTSLDGSWLVFDNVRLEGNGAVTLKTPLTVFVREAKAANYEVSGDGKRFQPLLVDVEHLTGKPVMSVRLDGNQVFKETVETGRYQFEVPMPTVSKPTESKYEILSDGQVIGTGIVKRTAQKPASYS